MIYNTDLNAVQNNIKEMHEHLIETNRRFQMEDAEGKWLILTNALQAFYCNNVGITFNDLWKTIDREAAKYYGIEDIV